MRTALVLLALLLAWPASAVAATTRATLPDVEDEVMCPVCGTPLNQAQAPQADRQRELIRNLIAQGKTKQQIMQRLVDEYGPEVLATPRSEGFELTAYAVPLVLGAAALALLAATLARARRRRPARTAPPSPLSGADARRLDDDLARYGS